MGAAQPLLQGRQQLHRKHRRFLHREQEFLAVHLQHLAHLQGPGGGMAPVVRHHEGTNAEHLPRLKAFPSTTLPGELDRSGEDAEDAVSRRAGLVENLLGH